MATPTIGREIVEGLLAPGDTVLLSGPPDVGKTTFLAHLVAQAACGGEVLGRRAGPAKVAWLAFEEAEPLTRRRFEHHAHKDLEGKIVFEFHDRMLKPDEMARAIERIADDGFELVVVDPLLAAVELKDMNDGARVREALNGLVTACQRRELALVATHHTSKRTSLRGGANTALGSIQFEATFRDKWTMVPVEFERRVFDFEARSKTREYRKRRIRANGPDSFETIEPVRPVKGRKANDVEEFIKAARPLLADGKTYYVNYLVKAAKIAGGKNGHELRARLEAAGVKLKRVKRGWLVIEVPGP
ncbi:MAG: hypothetical protein AMXMBFR81_19250 [Chthonomonas sp.]